MARTITARHPALRSPLRLTPLEDRTVPATITWLGNYNNAATGLYNVGSNWSGGVVPGAGDDAVIPNTSYNPQLTSATVTLKSLTVNNSAGNNYLYLNAGGKLTITNGLTLAPGAVLQTQDGTASVSAAGPTSIAGGFVQSLGGTITLSSVTALTGRLTLLAQGTGAVVSFPAVTSLSADTVDYGGMAISAYNGGTVNLSNVTSALDPATGGGYGRGFDIRAGGAGALVNLAKLASLSDLTAGGTQLYADNGGEVRTPLLTTLTNVAVQVIGAASVLPTAQITKFSSSTITAQDGATVPFTGLTSLVGPVSVQAIGAKAVLNLANVTSLGTDTVDYSGVTVYAGSGGTVNLSNATSALDPATGASYGRGFNVTSQSAGSVVNLAKLSSLVDLSAGGTSLNALGGGTVSVPLVTSLDNVTINIDGVGGTTPLAQVTSLTHVAVTVSNAATASFTGLTSLTGPLNFVATDSSSSLKFPNVTKLNADTVDYSGITLRAQNGATLDLSNATSALDPAAGSGYGRGFDVSAYGAKSLVNLAKLASLTDLTAGGTQLTADTGGEVRVPLVTTLNNVSVTVNGPTSVLPTTQLTKFTSGSVYAHGGATVTLSGITAYTGPVTLRADDASTTLNLSAATSLSTDTVDYSGIAVYAYYGGTVNLSNVTSALDPATGSSFGRGFYFNAYGAGSLVNLAKLATLSDLSAGGTQLTADNGGEVRIPLVTKLSNLSVTLNGATSILPLAQVTQATNASFNASNAATMGLTGLTSVTGPLTFTGYDANTRINLSNVTKLSTDTVDYSGISGTANSGSTIDLSNVTSALDPATGSSYGRGFYFNATGANSLVNLAKLSSLSDLSAGGTTLTAEYGGEMRVPLVTTLNNVTVNVRTATSVFPLAQVTQAKGSTINGYDAATLGLTGLTSLTGPLAFYSYTGALVNLTNVTSLSTDTVDQSGITLYADGGTIDASKVTQATDPAAGSAYGRGFNLYATGTGGLVNLSKLSKLTDLSPGGTSLSAYYGGELRVPLLTTLDNVTVTVNGPTSVLPLAQVTSLTRSYLVAQSGATVTPNGLTSLVGPVMLRAEYTGALLNLASVTKLSSGTVDSSAITVVASGGATVNLSNVTAADDSAPGGVFGRGFGFSAEFAGSLLDLSKLPTLVHQTNAHSYIQANYGGEVRVPVLTSTFNTDVQVYGETSTMPLAQLKTFNGGTLSFYELSTPRSLTGLTNFNNSSLYASNSAVTFPNLVTYTNGGTNTSFTVGGTGSVTLTGLRSLTLPGGSFTVAAPVLTLDTLSLTNGVQFYGCPSITVAKSLTWTDGYINGPGVLRLLAGGTGTINGTGFSLLGRTLENAGSLSYTGAALALGNADPGVISNLAGGTLTLTGDGDIAVNSGSSNAVTNAGTLVRTGSGTTTISAPFSSTGSIDVKAGRFETTGGGLAFNGGATFKSAAAATVTVDGSITGSTTASTGYAPLGTTIVSGGTAGTPRLFEAMGKDIGANIAGLQNNFALGTLQLNNAYMKLTDASDNFTGAGAEAVYLDRVDVPSGSTLDLNGLHMYVYTRTGTGAVINGTITLLVANVKSVTFNGGQPQRSTLSTAEVTFTTSVTLSSAAFTITRQSNGTTVPFTLSTAFVDGRTVATLTFGGGGLSDGYYGLKVTANLVTDAQNNKLDGDANGTPGGDFVYGGTNFFRYRGDFDGDGAVDGNDLAALAQGFNAVVGDANYRAYLDLDGDGAIDGNDLAIFAQRFNTVL